MRGSVLRPVKEGPSMRQVKEGPSMRRVKEGPSMRRVKEGPSTVKLVTRAAVVPRVCCERFCFETTGGTFTC